MNGKSLTNYTLSKKQTPVTHLVKSDGCKFIRNLTRSQIKKKSECVGPRRESLSNRQMFHPF